MTVQVSRQVSRTTLQRFAAFGVVFLLLATAACKSSGSSSVSSTSGGSAGSGASASASSTADPRAPGVTADTIKVGVTYVDLSTLKDVVGIDHGDYQKAYQAVADDINKKGGINGRKIQLVFAPVNPTGTNAAAAACTKLTQDEKVFVAVGFFLGDDVLCYVNTNPTPTLGGDMTNERLSKATVPWYTLNPSDDTETDVINAAAKAGKLSGKVAVVGMASDQQSYNQKIKPLLDQLKIDVVDSAFIDAPPTDAEANYAQAQTFAERFKSSGADHVLTIGGSVGQGWLKGLARTDYRPQQVFTVRGVIDAYAKTAGNDLSVLTGSSTGSTFDGGNQFDTLGDPTKECFDIQRAAGLTIKHSADVPKGDPDQFVSSNAACSQLYLLKAVLQKAGTDLNYGSFRFAGDNLGQIVLPGSPDPWTFGAPPHADGDPKIYVYNWDPAQGQFVVAPS
jgi:hypothetical protein